MNRTLRRIWASLALVVIVFAQLSVAAYACPAGGPQLEAMASPCDDAHAPTANLCDKHCNDHQQSSPVPFAPAPFAASFVAFLEREPASALFPPTVAELRHPISPPLTVSHCRWRI
jgi:hypothetical protein